ncbi:MAG: acetyltransferase [Thermodesulfobacteriota bacterium]
MKESILLIGGGGHCKSCIDVIEQEGRFTIAGILDQPPRVGEKVLSYPIIATDEALPSLAPAHWCLVTIGQIQSCATRLKLYDLLRQHHARLPAIVSPHAYVSPHATIGAGTIVMHGAIVNAGAQIGRNCIINTQSLVEHDAVVGDHCHIATASVINGGVRIGERSFIGSRAVTREYIAIGADCFIGSGVRVLGDLAPGSRDTGQKTG